MNDNDEDDEFDDVLARYLKMLDVLNKLTHSDDNEIRHLLRGSTNVHLCAAVLLLVDATSEVETALARFKDDVMYELETGDSTKGEAFKKWTTEELLNEYSPEVLEAIKRGDSELEVYDDRIVIKTPRKP